MFGKYKKQIDRYSSYKWNEVRKNSSQIESTFVRQIAPDHVNPRVLGRAVPFIGFLATNLQLRWQRSTPKNYPEFLERVA